MPATVNALFEKSMPFISDVEHVEACFSISLASWASEWYQIKIRIFSNVYLAQTLVRGDIGKLTSFINFGALYYH